LKSFPTRRFPDHYKAGPADRIELKKAPRSIISKNIPNTVASASALQKDACTWFQVSVGIGFAAARVVRGAGAFAAGARENVLPALQQARGGSSGDARPGGPGIGLPAARPRDAPPTVELGVGITCVKCGTRAFRMGSPGLTPWPFTRSWRDWPTRTDGGLHLDRRLASMENWIARKHKHMGKTGSVNIRNTGSPVNKNWH
jgi:hypothetical protein